MHPVLFSNYVINLIKVDKIRWINGFGDSFRGNFLSFGLSWNMNFYYEKWFFYTMPTLESVASRMVLTLTSQLNQLPPLLPPLLGLIVIYPLPPPIGLMKFIWTPSVWIWPSALGSPNLAGYAPLWPDYTICWFLGPHCILQHLVWIKRPQAPVQSY